MYKFKVALTVLSGVFVFLSGKGQLNNSSQLGDSFPKEAVWYNTTFSLNISMVNSKLAILLVSDMQCLECGYYANQIERLVQQVPQVQFVQVFVANGQPLSNQSVINFIQQNNYSHPIVIVPDVSGFQNTKIETLPHFLIYNKSDIPEYSEAGERGFAMAVSKIDEIKQNKSLAQGYTTSQIIPRIPTQHWANPLVELPTYLTTEDYGPAFFLNDLAHHRILKIDKNGITEAVIGSSILPGYSSNESEEIRFNHAGGMASNGGYLYVADTYNNRLREIDLERQSSRTVLGNGNLDSMALPTDVVVWKKNIYVADGLRSQIVCYNRIKGTTSVVAKLPSKKDGLKRVYPLNLASGKKGVYIVMSDGEILLLDKKARLNTVPALTHVKFSAVAEWEGGLVACSPETNAVYFKKRDNWQLLTNGADSLSKVAGVLPLNKPFDLEVFNGELIITDCENHLIRVMHSTGNSIPHRFDLALSDLLISDEPSHTFGQAVEMDTVFLAQETVAVKVKLDLQGYRMLPDGHNFAVLHDAPAVGELLDAQIEKEEFTFTINPTTQNELAYMELYLTLEHEASPGVAIIKRSYLVFQLESTTDKVKSIQELTYKPDLLPY